MTKRRKKATFYIEDLLKSERYKGKKDVLRAALNPLREYSLDEVDKAISDFLSKEVK